MRIKKYLKSRCGKVKDLVDGSSVDLLFVFESPHTDELKNKIPVSGKAGIDSLKFLMQDSSNQISFGRYLKTLHDKNDYRVAVINVSRVPLQNKTFKGKDKCPSLSSDDWAILYKIRKSKAKTFKDPKIEKVSKFILKNFKKRIKSIKFSTDSTVVLAGVCAQTFWEKSKIIHSSVLKVTHPSRGQWRDGNPKLEKLPILFKKATT